jgi:hypothetical protein
MKLKYSTRKKIYHVRKGLRLGLRFFLFVYVFMMVGSAILDAA